MQPFISRRNRLQKNLKSSDAFLIEQPNSVVRSNDTHYPYHPNRYFYYLTGFDEPNAWLLITASKTYLWSEPSNEKYELWNGSILGKNAIEELHIDDWYSINDPKSLMDKLSHINNLFLIGEIPENIIFSGKILEGKPSINHMRIIKDKYEIDVISKSCEISANAHNYMMAKTTQSKHETELMGLFLQSIMSQGAKTLAYEPIIASGKNALTLHYTKNNSAFSTKELILVDAGCEYQQYTSDISRTFPASGKFSKMQQCLYEACLDVQESTISLVKPGKTLQELHEFAVLKLTQHLIDLKIIETSLEDAINDQLFMPYFPHTIGHTLGLDVHDIPPIDGILKPGMVITIEPGIYLQSSNTGIRIEDDILITDNGYKNLTQTAVKSVSDIQNLMKS